MKPVHSQLPKGARIYLPDEAARKRYVEGRLLDVFARWGYREIVTPTFEFADVLAMGTDLGVQESMFKFVDRETGRMLALRADITPQIARVVATRLRDEPKPVRLACVTNVFNFSNSVLNPELKSRVPYSNNTTKQNVKKAKRTSQKSPRSSDMLPKLIC